MHIINQSVNFFWIKAATSDYMISMRKYHWKCHILQKITENRMKERYVLEFPENY